MSTIVLNCRPTEGSEQFRAYRRGPGDSEPDTVRPSLTVHAPQQTTAQGDEAVVTKDQRRRQLAREKYQRQQQRRAEQRRKARRRTVLGVAVAVVLVSVTTWYVTASPGADKKSDDL